MAQLVKNSPAMQETTCNTGHGFDPWVRRMPGEGDGYPLQHSYPRNPMDREASWATLHGAARVTHD